ncbi:GIN domain-containing protein [Massilia sp. GCM10020059]|uniref:DUF2807 domain-containing protein n=1 Tax=Massilia agrisoli TaxID=2892444 RepID=A0ABS8IQR9_9BURK|nr:DUF2807 domain-containing protein [Massilia agrisoli]MCC6070093.1 DUF2807 domain-containing protein [Massilia agrisoli]
MKTMLKQTSLAAAIAAGVLASPSLLAAPQDSELVTTHREIGAFRSIELSGPYRVAIKAQGRNALSMTGTRKDLAGVEAFVSGDTLVVRPVKRRGFSFSLNKVHERVTINISTPMLAKLATSGSGDVDVEQVSGERFAISLNGPGDVRASGAVRELQVNSSGSGELDLHLMRATRASLAMSGPGDVTIADISGTLSAHISGSGDLEGQRLRLASVAIDLHGPGGARLEGSSRELRAEIHGSGDLEACSLAVEAASAQMHGPGNGCIAGNLKKFDGQVHGSGDLSVSGLAARDVRLMLAGPGNVDLAGSTATLHADLSGSGDLDASRLAVTNATLRNRGPGAAELSNVAGTLDAELHGSGGLQATLSGKRLVLKMKGPADADISGTVDGLNAQLSGSGSLNARALVAGHADVVVSGPGNAVVNVRAKPDTRTAMLDKPRMVTIDRKGAREQHNFATCRSIPPSLHDHSTCAPSPFKSRAWRAPQRTIPIPVPTTTIPVKYLLTHEFGIPIVP